MTKEQLLNKLNEMEQRLSRSEASERQCRDTLKAELIKMQKLESLSVFASGVAHEYNNLLTAILGNLSLAKMYAKPGYEIYDVLTEAEKASVRAKDLTLELLFFAEGSQKKIPSSEAETELKTYPSGRGRILVMDDEEILRLVINKLLNQCGYETELAKDGEEMLKMYKAARESGQPFSAVIMDLAIEGGMGGQEAIKYLLEIDPYAKAIVSSGYSNAPAMSNYKEFGFIGFLAKPYRLEELGNLLDEVLTGKEE